MKSVRQIIGDLGGSQAVAKRLGITGQAVRVWMKENRVPEPRAFQIAHYYSDIVSVEDIRTEGEA